MFQPTYPAGIPARDELVWHKSPVGSSRFTFLADGRKVVELPQVGTVGALWQVEEAPAPKSRREEDYELAEHLADEFPGLAASFLLGNIK